MDPLALVKETIENEGVSFTDAAFELFMYNQIDQHQLFDVLNSKDNEYGNPLPDIFIGSDKPNQRMAVTSAHYEISDTVRRSPVVNRYLFYYLARKARKSNKYARELVRLANEITEGGKTDINLSFLFMRYVYLDTIGLKGTKEYPMDFYDLIVSQKLTTLYDLVICLFRTDKAVLGGMNISSKRSLLKKKLSGSSLVTYDVDAPFSRFALLMECALSVLKEKEINTLKIYFGVFQPGDLEDNDYYHSGDDAVRIVRAFRKKADIAACNAVRKYVRNNQKEFNEFRENGYSALYYALMECGD